MLWNGIKISGITTLNLFMCGPSLAWVFLEHFSMQSGDNAAVPLISKALDHVLGGKIVCMMFLKGGHQVWAKPISPSHWISFYQHQPLNSSLGRQIYSCGHSFIQWHRHRRLCVKRRSEAASCTHMANVYALHLQTFLQRSASPVEAKWLCLASTHCFGQ